jgi:hypothetical protein
MAAALLTAAAGLGSIAAAYVGVLPGPIQKVAHVTVGAPLPPHGSAHRPAAIASPHPRVTLAPGISATRPAHSAARARVHGGTASHWPRHRMSVQGPGPVAASCIPWPSPTQSAAKPSPTPSAAKPSLTPSAAKPTPTPSPSVTKAPVGTSQSPAGEDCPYIPAAGAAQAAVNG